MFTRRSTYKERVQATRVQSPTIIIIHRGNCTPAATIVYNSPIANQCRPENITFQYDLTA